MSPVERTTTGGLPAVDALNGLAEYASNLARASGDVQALAHARKFAAEVEAALDATQRRHSGHAEPVPQDCFVPHDALQADDRIPEQGGVPDYGDIPE